MKCLLSLSLLLCLLGTVNVRAQEFTLSSPDLGGQLTEEQLYSGYGCSGGNISPRLEWNNAPDGARSFAITVYDPDAPSGSGWWHWVMFNIPEAVKEVHTNAGNLQKGAAPRGSVQSMTDFGKPGYGGACPPKGGKIHMYLFTVYALDVPRLEAGVETLPAMVGLLLNKHALAKASLVSYYGHRQ